jgi:hypothetical protein
MDCCIPEIDQVITGLESSDVQRSDVENTRNIIKIEQNVCCGTIIHLLIQCKEHKKY